MANRPLALISVLNKQGIEPFAKGLVELGFEILSTGGTAKKLMDAGIPVTEVSHHTGFPEMMNGRVKTLHPKIHGGLLGDTRLEGHRADMATHDLRPITVLAVNLYAFEETISRPHTWEEAIENIDIGGPAMIRSASKNHANVLVAVDPADYDRVLEAAKGGDHDDLRRELAAKAFRHTAFYDATISRYFNEKVGLSGLECESLTVGLRKTIQFRYGENPHQVAALYEDPLAVHRHELGLAQAKQLWGKELSFNNVGDSSAAWELVGDLPRHSCAIIKHGNPCGAAAGPTCGESYRLARASDPVSAFGGIAAFHGVLDKAGAEALTEKGNFLEVVIAEGYSEEALEIIHHRSGWGQDVRLIEAALPGTGPRLELKTIRGGAIVQSCDEEPQGSQATFKVVTERQPSKADWDSLLFLWKVIPHVRSNAIVVGLGERMLGVGAGQMNRVQSVRLALEQAGELAKGAALASDAFFPFPDSVEAAAAAGITAIIQPGGSKKDELVIEAANRLGLVMVMTGFRHFKH